MTTAVGALGALAHAGRLAAFRLLVQQGPQGLAAGELARRLDTRANTLSTNLSVLVRAGLAVSHREGRSIIYAARFDRMAQLMGFLADHCCGGAPEVCAPVVQAMDRARCA